MKKIIMGSLVVLLSANLYATPNSTKAATVANTQSTSKTNATPDTTAPATSTSTATPNNNQATIPAQQDANATIINVSQPLNCNFRIPANVTSIDTSLVTKWAEKALQQSFNFDFTNVDKQLADLKNCYTDEGWKGFSDALNQSGNINAIKTQKLTASSMIDGKSQISETKTNQWRLTIPLHVVFQNDKEKVSQSLSVSMVVGRKINGDLGIMQVIASPRQLTPMTQNTNTNPSTNNAP